MRLTIRKILEFITICVLLFHTNDFAFSQVENDSLKIQRSKEFYELLNKRNDEYFNREFDLLGKEKWQQGKIKGATVIPRKELKKIFKHKNGWERFRNKYGNCLTSFSLPIFNATHDYCIVYHWTQCDYLAGGGSTDLFKFDNGKWVFVHSYTIGMS